MTRPRGGRYRLPLALGLALSAACSATRPAPPPRAVAPLLAVVAPSPSPLASPSPSPSPSPPVSPAPEPPSRLRKFTSWNGDRSMLPDDRVRHAETARRAVVQQLFAAAGLAFPPRELLFRAFKRDHELEVWAAPARGAPHALVATYEICGLSGTLGPKRREGDGQVPEGFYHLHYLWPDSNYHLEMKVGYPNDLDRHLSDHVPEGPGGNIMIHGSCASIGCLAMTDERVEELWVMAAAFQQGDDRVQVHIFPARDMAGLLRDPEHSGHWPFWSNLKEGYDLFERTHRLFRVEADWHAKYLFR